jgi:hypothetical protein
MPGERTPELSLRAKRSNLVAGNAIAPAAGSLRQRSILAMTLKSAPAATGFDFG